MMLKTAPPACRHSIPAIAAAACLGLASCTPSSLQTFASASLAPQAAPSIASEAQSLKLASLATPAGEALAMAAPAPRSDRVDAFAATLAADLAERCPTSDPGDPASFEQCRSAMIGNGKLDLRLASYTLWSPPHAEPGKPLRETLSTRVWPDTLVGVYLPLFMFSGTHAVSYSKAEKLYRIELGARFRNKLQAGQFPYRFWHGDAEWRAYENATAIVFWVEPQKLTVRFIQFSPGGTSSPATQKEPAMPASFEGTWMGTAPNGQAQAKDALFAGHFRPANPHLDQAGSTWTELVSSLRDGQCLACHVPSNPSRMKRLVLLHTPLHAASEIKRVLGAVERGSMPLSEISGAPEELAPSVKAVLLARAAAFEAAMADAKRWEAGQRSHKPVPVAASGAPRREVAVQKGN